MPITRTVPAAIKGYSNNAISSDNDAFSKNLWRRLFVSRMQAAFYDVSESGDTMVLTKNESENLSEYDAIEKISGLCQQEAEIIADELKKYLTAARKTVESKHEYSTDYSGIQDSESTDECGIEF